MERALVPMTPRPVNQSALEFVKDEEGSAVIGWVGESVFYVRFRGGLSAKIGMAHLARLGAVLKEVPSLSYFCDASALQSYDLLARGAFARLVSENRHKFSSLVMLSWAASITPSTRAFMSALGDTAKMLTSATEFDSLLLEAAPFAKRKLHPNAWVKAPLPDIVR
jgi:hypothetical protein